MIDYGAPPAADEFEVTLFGPVTAKRSPSIWGKELAPGRFVHRPRIQGPRLRNVLEQIGIDAGQVRAIVASHWHDDHVRGISQLAAKHPKADFVISAVFNNKEAGAFLAAYSGASSSGLAHGAKELFGVMRGRETVFPALYRTNVLEATLNTRQVRVTALSPVPAALPRLSRA